MERPDTLHIVNLPEYVWAARQVPQLGRSRVLGLACGTGYGSDYLSGKAGRVVEVDCAPQIITRNRARYGHPGASFLAMDGCALGFRDESFYCILSSYFLTIRWFGRRQGARFKAAERSMDAVRRFDPGGIRTLVPYPVRHWLSGLVS